MSSKTTTRIPPRPHGTPPAADAERSDGRRLTRLYTQYCPIVYRTAYRILLCPDEAWDVVHDVFLKLPGNLATYSGRGSFEGWLRRVGARAALMRLRGRRRARHWERVYCLAGATRSASFANRLIDRLALQQALAGLPDYQLSVFVLKEIEGYTHEEIGRRLGIAEGTSKARLHHARRKLQGILRDQPVLSVS
jgi:RNA polymerase sigma-70 factor (ECF subfamily)